jgi:transcriptional regulator with XRE-family HTH domain
MTTGQKIRKLRRDRNWTQAELGENAGINYRNLNRYEHDKLKPGAKMLAKLAAAFGVSIDEMAEDEMVPDLTIQDSDLFNCFRQAQAMGEEDKMVIKKLVQAMVVKNQVQTLGRLAG